MNAKAFIASQAGNGIARAVRSAGDAWDVEFLHSELDVRSLALVQSEKNLLFAGTQGAGVFRSNDLGSNWEQIGLDGKIVKSIAVSPHDHQIIYAGTKPAQIFKTLDGGVTWNELSSFRKIRGRWWWFSPAEAPMQAYVQAITISPGDPANILAGIELGAVVRSNDAGRTWSNHLKRSLRDCHNLMFHQHDGNWVYEAGGSGGGVSFSRDAGLSWSKNRKGLDRPYGWAIAADTVRPDLIYASLSPGPGKAHSNYNAQAYIFRSTAGGAWQKLSGGLPQPLNHMPYTLLTDSPGHIYAGLSNGDVWYSSDYGDSWAQLEFNLARIARSLVILI